MESKKIKLNESHFWTEEEGNPLNGEVWEDVVNLNADAIEDTIGEALYKGDKKDLTFEVDTDGYESLPGDVEGLAEDIVRTAKRDMSRWEIGAGWNGDMNSIDFTVLPNGEATKILVKFIDQEPESKTEALKEGKVVTQYVHYDDEGLPTAIADTMEQLANLLGVDKSAISLAIKRGNDDYAKVQYDEDDEFEDIDLSKLKDVQDACEALDKVNK